MLGWAGFTNISMSEIPLVWRVSSPNIIIDAMSSATVRAAAVLKRQSTEETASSDDLSKHPVMAAA